MQNSTTLEKRDSREHLPALDGLRAIAVIGVIIFHINATWLSGGFVGVDVFFVLSGFLITSILLNDINKNTFSFKEFYLRRIQRLLPNSILTVAVTILLLTYFMPAGLEIFTARHGIWNLFNLSNIYSWSLQGGYWDPKAEWAYFTHFWSLGVEEQYYLFFPLFLFLISRFARRHVHTILLLGTIASFAVCVWGSYNRAAFTFYWLPTRVWELLLGSLIASAGFSLFTPKEEKKHLPKIVNEVLGLGGVAAILISFSISMNFQFVFPGWIALLPTLGTGAILISLSTGESTLSKILSLRPFTATGKVSYSLYLWHWPLIVFGRMRAELFRYEWDTGAIVGGILSIAFGITAYYLVEKPLRNRGIGRSRRLTIIAGMFVGTLGLCVYTGWIKSFRTFPQFDPITVSAEYYAIGNSRVDANGLPIPTREGSPVSSSIFGYDVTAGKIVIEGVRRKVLEGGGLLHLHGGETPRVVLWGSSHANMFAPVFDEICRNKKYSIAFFGKNAEPPFNVVSKKFPEARVKAVKEFYEYKLKWLREWKPEFLFLCERWDRWYAWDEGDLSDFSKQFETFLNEVKPLGIKVVFVTQIPVSPHGEQMNPRACAEFLAAADGTLAKFLEPQYFIKAGAAMQTVLDDVAKRHSNLIVLRTKDRLLNPDTSIRYAEGRKFYYFDEDHLNDTGTRVFTQYFEKILEK